MSRYTQVVESTKDKKLYRIMTGYDRPLKYIFLDIEEVDAKNDEFVFDSLDEKSPFSIKDLSYYDETLKKFGIELPQELIEKIHLERDEQQGRR